MNVLALGLGSPVELAIIAVVVLILFGGSRLAGFGKSVGEGIRELKNEIGSSQEDVPTAAGTPDTKG